MDDKNLNPALIFSDIDINWQAVITGTITTAIVALAAIAIWYTLSKALRRIEKRHVSKQSLLPIRLFLRYGIFFGALILALSSFGIPIGNFWTFISTLLGLVAIGFVAVWSVLSNISSTFFILGFKPFKVGDYIKLVGDDISGRVLDVNFMFTTLRRPNGDLFRIPNNQFFQKSTHKLGDNGKVEEEEFKNATLESKTPDHSNQNLEGINTDANKR